MGLPFPSPRALPDSGIELRCPALQADSLASQLPPKPMFSLCFNVMTSHEKVLTRVQLSKLKIPRERNGTHSNVLAGEITRTEEPSGILSMGVAKSLTQLSE